MIATNGYAVQDATSAGLIPAALSKSGLVNRASCSPSRVGHDFRRISR